MTGIIEVQKGQVASLPVILTDDTDFKTPETGVAFGSVTCDYAKEGDSSLTNYALSGQWDEIGRGIYEVDFTGSELDTLGLFKYVVYGSGYLQYDGCVMVVDHNPKEAIQAIIDKLPTNYIMGSSDQTDKDDELDAIVGYLDTEVAAIKAKTDNLPSDPADQSLIVAATDAIVVEVNANETKIDTAISEIAKITPEVSVHIEHPEEIKIPDGHSTLDGAFASGAVTLDLDDASGFPSKGYFKCESEWCYYGAKSSDTLSSIVRGLFGTGDVTHADGTDVYQGIPVRTILTIHDAGEPLAPNSVPTIAIDDMEGNAILGATSMTQEGAKVGIYYYNLLYDSSQAYPDVFIFNYVVEALSGKINEYRRMSILVGESATASDLGDSAGVPTAGLRQATHAGYLDGVGVWHVWTDAQVGAYTDAQGDYIFRGIVVWQHIVGGSVKRQVNPPASTFTEADGEWAVYIAPGTYMVHFWKDGIKDAEIQRVVT